MTRSAGIAFSAIGVLACLLLVQCTSYSRVLGLDEDLVFDTDLTPTDLRTAANKAAASLAECKIATSNNPIRVAFMRMENRTIEDEFDSYDLLDRIRTHLVKESNGAISFVDRKTLDRIMKERGWRELNSENCEELSRLMDIDYFLTGRAFSHSKRRRGEREVYYRLSFRLTDAETSEVVWGNDHECKYYGKYEAINR